MLQPGLHANTSDYRYGFQGQEMDDEVKGEGNSINYKYRMHDPRVGRFFATDPLEKKYPMLTPYQFSSNRPIDSKELEGLEGFQHTKYDIVNGVKVPIAQIVEVDIYVLVTSNKNDKISFKKGSGDDVKNILDSNYNPTYNDTKRNRRLGRANMSKEKFTTTIEGNVVPVEFKFNVFEKEISGSKDKRERFTQFYKEVEKETKNDFNIGGVDIRRGITIAQLLEFDINSPTLATSGGNGIKFRTGKIGRIIHEIIHNFFSYNEKYVMGDSSKKHADESIGGGGALLYGSDSPPNQNNVDHILKTLPNINESDIPDKNEINTTE
ncbi:RHS repeat-associated core domain-containing protein [Aequorivita antarctica]|uniref:RHS repeat-associated core domain-containing protein n=1 Tax=Aequorivita antarctica TaxID=153266 RepID=A0A5C6YZZ7_9FLAO|nr:RHS repeat-associated core domain-containing protein [Aequorivita antarctica]TXD72792.1 hypothetical protein ESU54_11285 [Aequorivita antarctica]